MDRYLNRKSFVTTLGVAGLGLAAGARAAFAQDDADATPEVAMLEGDLDFREKRVELYNAFTAALAEELNVASADEVDGAIRVAIMSVIDEQVGDDGLTAGQAEALKSLVATSDVPLGGMAFWAGPGMPFRGRGHRPGFGMGEGRRGHGHGRDWDWDRDWDRDGTGERTGAARPGAAPETDEVEQEDASSS